MKKLTHQLLFVSDIHLYSAEDERGQLLLEIIEMIDPKSVEYFILGGDIFDFCFGASRYFKEKFKKFGNALEKLSTLGTKVIFVQGNHEFSLDGLKWSGIDFVTGQQRCFQLSCGTTFSVTHGDRFLMDWSYRYYIALTRSSIFRGLALLLPQKKLDQFALYCSRISRNRGYSQSLDHKKVLSAAALWLENTGSQFGLFGHFHHPYEESYEFGSLFSVHSWHQPNLLAFHKGKFSRIEL
ncbi:MAG: metallophosphoesterase [Bdellovibrionota bacterium]